MLSALMLSEAVFVPLMLAALLGVAVLWPARMGLGQRRADAARRSGLVALGSGAAAGAAILVRPSWALFVPVMLVAWVVAEPAADRRQGRAAAPRRGPLRDRPRAW